MVFEKGKSDYNDYELKYGPILLKDLSPIFIDYLRLEKSKLINVYKVLGIKHIFKKIKIKKDIKFINKITKL